MVATRWGLATVERRSTTEHVLSELRAAIIDGRIGPRAPLREVALADAFGTGRSAIREALSALQQEGLVVSERNRGTWVRELSCDDVVDVYRAREAIETAAVAAALERSSYDLSLLRAALHELRTVCDRDGMRSPSQALIAADIDFHRTLVALAESQRLSRAHEPLAAEAQMLLNWHPVYSGSDYVDDHQQLLDAFEGGDAVAAVREHLRLSERLIVAVVETYSSRLRVVDDGAATATTEEADR
ncbi:MAG TPA: GntR family transcriptional regulator [Solirubrobacteraceae bacterium]|nr:GntR family transcriptional regulator [Solirubrobacteraceae bacterium]